MTPGGLVWATGRPSQSKSSVTAVVKRYSQYVFYTGMFDSDYSSIWHCLPPVLSFLRLSCDALVFCRFVDLLAKDRAEERKSCVGSLSRSLSLSVSRALCRVLPTFLQGGIRDLPRGWSGAGLRGLGEVLRCEPDGHGLAGVHGCDGGGPV